LRKRIYISHAITQPQPTRLYNYYIAVEVYRRLILDGWAVFCPALSMMLPDNMLIPHGVWLEQDLPWVEASDIVLRLPGSSTGGDIETDFAVTRGILVVGPEYFPCLADLFPVVAA
jgi:hypothetical protein